MFKAIKIEEEADDKQETVETVEQEKETLDDSQSEENQEGEKESEDTEVATKETEEENTPFHKRWKKREEKLRAEYDQKFQELEEKLSKKDVSPKEDEQDLNIPPWFIGDEDAYRTYLAEKEAEKEKLFEEFENRKAQEKEEKERQVKEYEDNYDSQVDSLEEAIGKDLSDSDKNKLFNFIVNELEEEERPLMANGLYNIRAAYRMFQAQNSSKKPIEDKKSVANKTLEGNNSSAEGDDKVWSSNDFRRFR